MNACSCCYSKCRRKASRTHQLKCVVCYCFCISTKQNGESASDAFLPAEYNDGTELTINADIIGILYDGDILPTLQQMKVSRSS